MLVYPVGLILIAWTLASGDFDLGSLAIALGLWWITAGIALRLGVTPIDFFRRLGTRGRMDRLED